MFRTVSPIFRENIYAGVGMDGIKSNESPIDFFGENIETNPMTSSINFNEVTL